MVQPALRYKNANDVVENVYADVDPVRCSKDPLDNTPKMTRHNIIMFSVYTTVGLSNPTVYLQWIDCATFDQFQLTRVARVIIIRPRTV